MPKLDLPCSSSIMIPRICNELTRPSQSLNERFVRACSRAVAHCTSLKCQRLNGPVANPRPPKLPIAGRCDGVEWRLSFPRPLGSTLFDQSLTNATRLVTFVSRDGMNGGAGSGSVCQCHCPVLVLVLPLVWVTRPAYAIEREHRA